MVRLSSASMKEHDGHVICNTVACSHNVYISLAILEQSSTTSSKTALSW